MKRILFVIALLMITGLSFGQKLFYNGWEIRDPMYGYNNDAPTEDISFENLGKGSYRIEGYGGGGEYKSLICEFKYSSYDKESEEYVYIGWMKYGKLSFEAVILRTKVKLSQYSNGKSIPLYNVLLLMPQYKNDKGEWSGYRLFKLRLL